MCAAKLPWSLEGTLFILCSSYSADENMDETKPPALAKDTFVSSTLVIPCLLLLLMCFFTILRKSVPDSLLPCFVPLIYFK